jgi:hypothetical protein
MSLLHLKFIPLLDFWTDVANLSRQYPTTDAAMDGILQENLTSDTIHFQNVYRSDQWEPYQYTFDTADNLIHLWVRNPTGDVSVEALKQAVAAYAAPFTVGILDLPDADIVDEATAQSWGYQSVEMRPQLTEVWLLIPDGKGEYQQHQVDRARL